MTRALSWLIPLVFALPASCHERAERAPALVSCLPGQHCPIGFGTLGGPTTQPGSGEGGEGGVGATSELLGTVVDLVDDSFQTSVAYPDRAIVAARAPGGSVTSTVFNGSDPFLLTDIAVESPTWILVRPESGVVSLPTLHPLPTLDDVPALGLVRANTFDEILSLLSLPTQRTSGAGQVILEFTLSVGSTRVGAAGVTASIPEAQVVAYRSGAIWSSDVYVTDDSGLVVLANMPAASFPGTVRHVTLGGNASGSFDVRVAADSVSLIEVPLSP